LQRCSVDGRKRAEGEPGSTKIIKQKFFGINAKGNPKQSSNGQPGIH
jgi:hypothetical protein